MIKNFRQFLGETVIDFASGEKNVTVISGTNGAGKTSIFRAIVFCLYGEKYLEHDTKNTEIHFANWGILDSEPVANAEVSLKFEHDENEYVVCRNCVESRRNNKTFEVKNMASLFSIDKYTGEKHLIKDRKDDVNNFISKILPKNVKNLFFFDAERLELIEQLENQGKTINKIQSGVYDLLQLNSLAKGKDILNTAYNEQSSLLSKSAGNIHMDDLKDQLLEKSTLLENSKIKSESAKENQERVQKKLDGLEAEILENQDLQDLSKDRKKLKEILDQVNEFSDSLFKNSQINLDKFAKGLLTTSFIGVDVKISDMQSESKDIFPKQILEHSLDNGVCMLCGSSLDHHNRREHIKKFLDQYEESTVTPVLNMINRSIDKVKDDSEKYNELLKNNYSKLCEQEDKSSEYEQEISDIEMKLTGSEDLVKNLEEKSEKTINTLKKDLYDFEHQWEKEILSQETLKKEINGIKQQISEIHFKNQKLNKMKLAMEKTKEIADQVDNIMSNYATGSRKHLEQQVKDIYNKLIVNDKDLLNKLTIDENFELSIQRNEGSNLIGNLSEGQRQILSLSFITALATLASKGREHEVSFPLFMDTPFARLDVGNKGNLIRNIPRLSNQWIILVTDSELSENEINAFIEHGKVGKVYRIEKVGKDLSQIEPYKLDLLLQESRKTNGQL